MKSIVIDSENSIETLNYRITATEEKIEVLQDEMEETTRKHRK